MSHSRSIEDQMLRATQRMAQKKARELLRENRQVMRLRNRRRRDLMRRRLELGDLVLACGLDELDRPTLTGLLLQGKDRARAPNERLSMRRRGDDPDGKRVTRARPGAPGSATTGEHAAQSQHSDQS